MKPTMRCLRLARTVLAGALALGAPALVAHAAEPTKNAVERAAADALWNGDFASLERQNEALKTPGSFAPDGSFQLAYFHQGLAEVFDNDVENVELYLKEMDALTLEWATAHPTSGLAHGLHAHALIAHGWSYRGKRYAGEVPREAMAEFQAYLTRAFDYLKTHADVALKDSYSQLQLLEIGMGLNWSRTHMEAIMNDGFKRNPNDTDLAFKMVTALLPKWGGTPRQLDDFINRVSDQTRTRFGMGMYASLYTYAADSQFGSGLFENTPVEWGKMKQGFEDWKARYPNNVYRLNAYARMACLAKDKPTFQTLIGQVDAKPDLSAWGNNPERALELCRRWAAQP